MLWILAGLASVPTADEVVAIDLSDTDLKSTLEHKLGAVRAFEETLRPHVGGENRAGAAFELARAKEDFAASLLGLRSPMPIDEDPLASFRASVLGIAAQPCAVARRLYAITVELDPSHEVARERLSALTGEPTTRQQASAAAEAWLKTNGPTAKERRVFERRERERKRAQSRKPPEDEEEYSLLGMLLGPPTAETYAPPAPVTDTPPLSGKDRLIEALSDPEIAACQAARDW